MLTSVCPSTTGCTYMCLEFMCLEFHKPLNHVPSVGPEAGVP